MKVDQFSGGVMVISASKEKFLDASAEAAPEPVMDDPVQPQRVVEIAPVQPLVPPDGKE